MRKVLHLACLLIFPLLSNATATVVFHSSDHYINFEVKKSGNKLQVYDAYYREKSQYKNVGKNNFRNQSGDMIKLVSGEKILFRPAYGRNIYELYRHDDCNNSKYGQNSRNSDFNENWRNNQSNGSNNGDWRNDHTSRNEYKNQNRGSYNQSQNDWDENDKNWGNENSNAHTRNDTNPTHGSTYNNNSTVLSTSLEGTWEANINNKSVVILNTRDGIKAKFSGTKDWVDYKKSDYSSHFYVDNKENRYEIKGNGALTWVGNKGKNRIELRKVSDELRF